MDDRRTKTSLLLRCDVSQLVMAATAQVIKAYEMGHISMQIPSFLQISINFGCFVIENLRRICSQLFRRKNGLLGRD